MTEQTKVDAGRAMHTPGPFHLDGTYVLDGSSRTIATCDVSPRIPRSEKVANAYLFAAAPDLLECAEILEKAEETRANCDECEGEGPPELCEKCFPLFDDARVKRRAALAAAKEPRP